MPDPNVFWYCVAAFGVLVVAGFGLVPIPEEAVVIGAGGWVAANPEYAPYSWAILPVCIVGILCSDLLLYSIGRFFGSRLLQHPWLARFLTPEKLRRIQHNFHRYGIKVLLFVRWVPGIRSPLFLTAGTTRVPLARFVLADGIAAACGHTLLFFLSYWFTDSFKELYELVRGDLKRLTPLLVVVSILAVGVYLLIHFLRKPVPTADPEELPIIGHQVAVTIENPEPPAESEPKPAADDGKVESEQVTANRPGAQR